MCSIPSVSSNVLRTMVVIIIIVTCAHRQDAHVPPLQRRRKSSEPLIVRHSNRFGLAVPNIALGLDRSAGCMISSCARKLRKLIPYSSFGYPGTVA